jgi:hypothetical protein
LAPHWQDSQPGPAPDASAGSRIANRALRVRHCRGRRIAAAGEGGVEFVA